MPLEGNNLNIRQIYSTISNAIKRAGRLISYAKSRIHGNECVNIHVYSALNQDNVITEG